MITHFPLASVEYQSLIFLFCIKSNLAISEEKNIYEL